MVNFAQVPDELVERIKATGFWDSGWTPSTSGAQEHLATSFRLSTGRRVDLIIDRSATILFLLNPLTYAKGEPIDPSSVFFDFDPKEIVALVGQRKVKTGLFPWQSKTEYFDLVSINKQTSPS